MHFWQKFNLSSYYLNGTNYFNDLKIHDIFHVARCLHLRMIDYTLQKYIRTIYESNKYCFLSAQKKNHFGFTDVTKANETRNLFRIALVPKFEHVG